MNEVGFNNKFVELQSRYQALLEESAKQIELYTHLVSIVGPNIKSRYMILIGQFEHRVYELKTEISRWKRRFTLHQKALNRREKPDFVIIEAELDNEFSQYIETVKKHIQEVKEASVVLHSAKVSPEETAEIRAAYFEAVKKLHPDINPDLPDGAKNLWNHIRDAYENEDWEDVKYLSGLVDSVINGQKTFVASADGMAELEASIAKLEAKCRELSEKLAVLKTRPPFTYEELLADDTRVEERRKQLFAQIKALEDIIKEYQKLWKNDKRPHDSHRQLA